MQREIPNFDKYVLSEQTKESLKTPDFDIWQSPSFVTKFNRNDRPVFQVWEEEVWRVESHYLVSSSWDHCRRPPLDIEYFHTSAVSVDGVSLPGPKACLSGKTPAGEYIMQKYFATSFWFGNKFIACETEKQFMWLWFQQLPNHQTTIIYQQLYNEMKIETKAKRKHIDNREEFYNSYIGWYKENKKR